MKSNKATDDEELVLLETNSENSCYSKYKNVSQLSPQSIRTYPNYQGLRQKDICSIANNTFIVEYQLIMLK